MSLLLKSFSLRDFHIYHNSHGNTFITSVPTPCSFARHRRKSILAYKELHGKTPGVHGTEDKAHTCKAGGHSNSMWFIDSDSAPHLTHILSVVQCRSLSLLAVATKPEIACHIKCFIFLGAFVFHAAFFKDVVLGSTISGFTDFIRRS